MEINFDPRFKLPFTAILSGSSGCGKSYFVKALLENMDQTMSTRPDKVIWCYGAYQPLYDELGKHVNVHFMEGLPSSLTDESLFPPGNNLLVVDDCMAEALNCDEICKAFTMYRHHRKLSVILLVQNLFHQGKYSRTLSLNANYLILFKSPRDKLQIRILAQQMFPGQKDYFLQVFNDATREPFSYLIVDLRPECSEELRLRTGILPHQWSVVYQYKK